MGFMLPNLPTPKAYDVELADFWEIETIKQPNRYVSVLDISRILSIGLDELNHDGIDSEDDAIQIKMEGVFQELLKRKRSCSGSRYPFSNKLSSIQLVEDDCLFKQVYLFLLLITRNNMQKNREFNGVNATVTFEFLCSEVAKTYFGDNAKSIVFGTAVEGGFKEKVEDLTSKLNEGGGYRNRNKTEPKKNDDAVDVVVWKEFADQEPGKLIGFGQCKTGTSWTDTFIRLSPKNFCQTWMIDSPILEPIPIVFIADTFNFELNFPEFQRGYMFFNRFRIMQYLPEELDEELEKEIRLWNKGAIEALKN